MEQEDLIKREIDQMGKVLRAILSRFLGLKNDGKIDEAMSYADEALKSKSKLNFDEIIALPSEKFILTLIDEKKFSNVSINLLADVLFNMANTLNIKGETEKATSLFQKALQIFEYLILVEKTYSFDWYFKVGQIKNKLATV